MSERHKHHIVPRHAGGDDDPLNVTPPISVRLHAAFHHDRWKHVGDVSDFYAWKMLLGKRVAGYRHSDDHREAIADGVRAWHQRMSPEQRLARNAVLKNVGLRNGGRPHSPETKAKIAEITRRQWSKPSVRASMVKAIGEANKRRNKTLSHEGRRAITAKARAARRASAAKNRAERGMS